LYAGNSEGAPHLPTGVKKLINDIFDDVISKWPPFKDTTTAESQNVMILVTPHALYELVFKDKLQLRVNSELNKRLQVSNLW
jgi:hypothetical protein